MKPFSLHPSRNVVLLIALFVAFVYANSSDNNNLTACGISCLNQSATSFGCDLSSTTCRCRSNMLETAMECLSDSCVMDDIMDVFKAQASICNLSHEDQSAKSIAGAIVSITMVVLSTLVRIGGKFATKRQGRDDVFIMVCFMLSIATFSLMIVNSMKGLGRHMWDVADTQTVVEILQLVFAVKINLPIAITLTKIAIVFFYMSIFRSARSRTAAWILVGFLVLTGLATTLTGLLECRPIAFFWNKDLKPGACNSNLVTHGLGVALSVLQDICLVTFPACHIGRLQMRRKQKVLVIAMFTLGGLGCLAAIVHLVQVIRAPHTGDPTWDSAKLETWAGVELIICYMGACLPMLAACLSLFFPRFFGTTIPTGTQPSRPPGHLSHGVTKTLPSKSQSFTPRQASLQPMELSLMRPDNNNDEWDRTSSPPLTPTPVYLGRESNSDTLEQGQFIEQMYEGKALVR